MARPERGREDAVIDATPRSTDRPRRWAGPRAGGPLRRDLEARAVAGVAAGVARRLGVDRNLVRAAFVLAMVPGGMGVAAYGLAWLLVPADGEDTSVATRALADRRGLALVVALVPVLGLLLVTASALGAPWLSAIAWPLFLTTGALVLVWRNVGPTERGLLEQLVGSFARPGSRPRGAPVRFVVRVTAGGLLVLGGVLTLTHGRRGGPGVLAPIGGLVLVAGGIAVAFGPWWLQIARDLVSERQARARAEERAELAARLHDSVLQTLALIQRRAGDPHEVVGLARAQERELRAWLFGNRAPGEIDEDRLSAAIERIQRDVEARHGVAVEAVVVGDCLLDDDLRSLAEAAREATVNAARWSGAPSVSLFVEVGDELVACFVRDRGIGFDEGTVPEHRRGVSGSIRARMQRHGGTAEIRSRPGEGTEVALTMPRRPARAGAGAAGGER